MILARRLLAAALAAWLIAAAPAAAQMTLLLGAGPGAPGAGGGGGGGYCNGDDSTIPAGASGAAAIKHMDPAAWVALHLVTGSPTANTGETTDPFGTSTAWKVEADDVGAAGEHSLTTDWASMPSGAVVAAYFCVKAKTGTHWVDVYILTAQGEYQHALIDLTDTSPAGTDVSATVVADSKCDDFGSGGGCHVQVVKTTTTWFRVILWRSTAGSSSTPKIATVAANAATLPAYPYIPSYFTGGPDFTWYLLP